MTDWQVFLLSGFIIFCGGVAVGWVCKPDPHFLVEMRGATGGAFTGPMSKENCILVQAEMYKREAQYKIDHPDDKQGELQVICFPLN
jgi:hypothetical protein